MVKICRTTILYGAAYKIWGDKTFLDKNQRLINNNLELGKLRGVVINYQVKSESVTNGLPLTLLSPLTKLYPKSIEYMY